MKSIIKRIMIAGCLLIATSPFLHSRTLETIILLDSGFTENRYREQRCFNLELGEAIQQKTAPIIVSGVMLYALLADKNDFAQKVLIENSPEQIFDILVTQIAQKTTALKKTYKGLNNQVSASDELGKQFERKLKELNDYTEKSSNLLQSIKRDLSELENQPDTEKALEDIKKKQNDLDDLNKKINPLQKEVDTLLAKKTSLTSNLSSSIKIEQPTIANQLADLYQDFYQTPLKVGSRYACYKSNFSFDEWLVYKHSEADLYLLVPKDYETKVLKEFQNTLNNHKLPKAYTEREIALGFVVEHKDILFPIESEQTLITDLAKKWDTPKMRALGKSGDALTGIFFLLNRVNAEKVQDFFVSGKDPIFGKWNIFLAGHGWYSRKDYAKTATDKDPRAFIAGLDLDNFSQLLTFLRQSLQTASLYYTTCFSGGYHLKVVAEILDQIDEETKVKDVEKELLQSNPFDCMVISGCITDVTTRAVLLSLENLVGYSQGQPTLNFKNYFSTMREFEDKTTSLQAMTLVREELLKKKKPQPKPSEQTNRTTRLYKLFIKHENLLKEALTYLSPWQNGDSEDLHGIAGVPSLWFPGSREFKAVPVGNAIIVIDKTLIDLETPVHNEIVVPATMKAALVYPKYIPTPITISRNEKDNYTLPALVSMINGPAEHHLKELIVDIDPFPTSLYENRYAFADEPGYKLPPYALATIPKKKHQNFIPEKSTDEKKEATPETPDTTEKTSPDTSSCTFLECTVNQLLEESFLSLKSVYKKVWFIDSVSFVDEEGEDVIKKFALREEQSTGLFTSVPKDLTGKVIYTATADDGKETYHVGTLSLGECSGCGQVHSSIEWQEVSWNKAQKIYKDILGKSYNTYFPSGEKIK